MAWTTKLDLGKKAALKSSLANYGEHSTHFLYFWQLLKAC